MAYDYCVWCVVYSVPMKLSVDNPPDFYALADRRSENATFRLNFKKGNKNVTSKFLQISFKTNGCPLEH